MHHPHTKSQASHSQNSEKKMVTETKDPKNIEESHFGTGIDELLSFSLENQLVKNVRGVVRACGDAVLPIKATKVVFPTSKKETTVNIFAIDIHLRT